MHSQGLTNFAEIAAQTPQFSASFGTSRTQSTFAGAASSGLNEVNLRNLNARRTLVLINGRRVPSGTTFNSAVDFNTIPTANIERIDVLTGGASAIYGADAVAGAINIITKKLDGVEIGGNYSITGDHDNKSPGGYLMMGGEFGDRGHGGLTVQYEDEGIVHCSDRYLCAQDVTWFTPDQFIRGPAAYSAVGANGKFQLGNSGPFYTSRNGSFTDAKGALIPFSIPIDGYNRNAVRTLAIPTKRLMFASGRTGVRRGAARVGDTDTDGVVESVDVAHVIPVGSIGVEVEFSERGARKTCCTGTLQSNAATLSGRADCGTGAIATSAAPDSADPTRVERKAHPRARSHLPTTIGVGGGIDAWVHGIAAVVHDCEVRGSCGPARQGRQRGQQQNKFASWSVSSIHLRSLFPELARAVGPVSRGEDAIQVTLERMWVRRDMSL